LCRTGIVYARSIDGDVLTFGVEGSLIYNSLVMYDRETDSLWSQFLGEAVDGPRRGTKLEFVPSQIVTWGAWMKEHPSTLFLSTGGSSRPFDSYDEYYGDPDMIGANGETYVDNRFGTKETVLGVAIGQDARAYSFGDLNRSMLINDALGGMEIVVVYEQQSNVAAVFARIVAGRALTFFQADEPLHIIDEETNSVCNKLDGRAISGPLEGEQLTMVPSFQLFWFAWSDFYPGTSIYGE
jgi:hypothetical protein